MYLRDLFRSVFAISQADSILVHSTAIADAATRLRLESSRAGIYDYEIIILAVHCEM